VIIGGQNQLLDGKPQGGEQGMAPAAAAAASAQQPRPAAAATSQQATQLGDAGLRSHLVRYRF